MSITIYPSQFNMREDGSYVQLPAIKGEEGQQGPPGIGSITGGTKGQVPVKQSSDDYDVAWEDIGWKLVWQNANPSSDFAAQTVSLDLSGFTLVAIFFSNDGIETGHTVLAPVGCSVSGDYFTTYNNAMYPKRRAFSVSLTGISFEDNKEYSTTKNAQNKPLYIYAQ